MIRHLALMSLFLAAGLVVAADDKKEDAIKKEMKALEGNWKIGREESNGNLVPPGVTMRRSILVEDDKIKWLMDGKDQGDQMGNFTIDPTKTPKTIDLEITRGGWIGKKMLGIYKLDGDKLDICWAKPGAEKRPTKFVTKPSIGSGETYTNYKKVKE